MSGILGPLAVVPVSSDPRADIPDYVEPARAFFGDDAAVDAYLTQLEGYAADGAEATDLLDAAEAAGTVAEAIAILESGPSQSFSEKAGALVDGDCVAMILPTPDASPYLEDLSGTLDTTDWNTALNILTGQPAGGYGARSGSSTTLGASGPLQIVGELSVHLVITDTSAAGGAAGYLASVSGVGEAEDANYLWSLEAGSNFFAYFAETGAGTNLTATWTRAQTASKSRSLLLSMTRAASGRIRLYENGVALVCSATNVGTIGPAGAYVDLTLPSGGSASSLWFGSDPTEPPPVADIHLLGMFAAEHSGAKVLEIAQALGYAS
jgi:hypothetical protein